MTDTATPGKPVAAPPAMASLRSVPPRVVIPSKAIQRAKSSSSSSTPTAKASKASEKIGRWTEEEHVVFLDGLEKHGKQWKTIATMIGTRSVVQVRTHAQKYFQKIERKNQSKPIEAVAPKRKSLPASLPSRKKGSSPKKPRISISLSTLSPSPPPMDSGFLLPIYSSASSENLSTISPVGVTDIEHFSSGDSFNLDEWVEPDHDGVGEDPLEWLMENDTMQHLPESSMPIFPDFSDLSETSSIHLQPQSQALDVMDSLPHLADPKVTVQALFLEDY